MKNKKFKGFSLAELLISLLIISIVLSAAIPTLTRRAGAGREFIWRWSQQQNNNAYFGVGRNQSAIIGADAIPLKGSGLDKIIFDKEINIANVRYTNNGDKLILVKKPSDFDDKGAADFTNSHISFYTAESSKDDETTSDLTYAGRIATGKHDLAFGIGTLQSLTVAETNNTAIGHYALLKNTTGLKNTAIGEKALSFNITGKNNTAVGYKSLFNEGYSSTTNQALETASNTAVGHESATALQAGSSNSVLGAQALSTLIKGDDNVVLGFESLIAAEEGSKNVVIGSQACSFITKGDNNICIGYQAGATTEKDAEGNAKPESSNYGLFIGTSDNSMPIISGHSQKISYDKKDYEKELDINARTFSVRPYNGGTNIFQVNAYANDAGKGYKGNGYGTNSKDGYTGEVLMHFTGDSGDPSINAGISLSFSGEIKNGKNYAVLGSMDYNKIKAGQNKDYAVINLTLNDFLDFDFPQMTTTATSNYIVSMITSKENYSLNLNNQIQMNRTGNTPTIKLDANNGFLLENKNNVKFQIKDNYLNLQNSTGSFLADLNSKFEYKSGTDYLLSLDKTQKAFMLTIGNDTINFGNGQAYFSAVNKKNISGNIAGYTLKLNGQLQDDLKAIVDGMVNMYTDLSSKITPSDERLKNISGDSKAGLKEINALEVKNYTYKADKNKTPHVGVIAQQLQKVFPNSVFKGEDGYLRITKDEIFYAMVNSIKELFKQIQDLTAKITGLDKRITELEKQNAQLKKQNAEFEKRLSRLERVSR